MKGTEDFKRKWRYEISCVNVTLVIILAAVAVVLGALFAISGAGRYLYWYFLQPRCAPAPFFMVLLWGIAYALLGASVGAALSVPCRHAVTRRRIALAFACALILCYVWIPVVYRAASFFLGTLLVAVIILCLAVLFSLVSRISRLASWGVLVFAVWMLYILYYTFALGLIN